MDIKDMIVNKLIQYLSDEIKKEDLYNDIIIILHEMLNGSIFQLRNLEIWGILTEIADIDDIDDFHCKQIVKKSYEVLTGTKSSIFTFAIQIPKEYRGDCFVGLEEMLLKYSAERRFSAEGLRRVRTLMKKQIDVIQTLNEFLEVQIIDLLKLGYMFCDETSSKSFELKSSVFISDEEADTLEDKLLNKIIALLECYNGKKIFFIQIVYKDGRGNISTFA